MAQLPNVTNPCKYGHEAGGTVAAKGPPMKNPRALPALLRALATTAAVGGFSAATAACAATEIDIPSDFVENLCPAGKDVVDDLAPEPALDYVALLGTSAEHGVACSGATQQTACLEALSAAKASPPASWGRGFDGIGESLVGTRGDTVVTAGTTKDLVGILGKINTLGEAMLVARTADYRSDCDARARGRATASGYDMVLRRGSSCGSGNELVEAIVHVGPDGALSETESVVVEKGDPNCAIGRRPGGHETSPASPTTTNDRESLGAFLGKIAQLEAASVVAFAQLEREYAALGAPERLLKKMRQARRDEVRHARTMTNLATAHGATVPAVVARPFRALPTLATLAAENLVEGCLRETFGALVAAVQATRAENPRIRLALARIAIDEAAHAALSWELHQWAEARLDRRARQHLNAAIAPALATLREEAAATYSAEITSQTGMPSGAEAVALVDALVETLGLTAQAA